MNTMNSKLKSVLSGVDVVSFDVFDTLIVRPFVRPIDLFALVAEESATPDFQRRRIDAEMAVRRRVIEGGLRDEVTLDEIYKELGKYEDLKDVEIELEIQLSQPNAEMVELFEYAKREGKIVVLNSDMYLPREVIVNMLEHCGIKGYDAFYLSSDWMKSKAKGTAYQGLKQKYPGKKIMQIGDNRYTDFEIAKEQGLDALFAQKPLDEFAEKGSLLSRESLQRLTEEGSLGSSACLATIVHFWNSKKEESQDFWYRIGYQVVWPIVMAFNQWLRECCEENEIEDIYFCTRDGCIFKEVFDSLFNDDDRFSTNILFASRRFVSIHAVDLLSEVEIRCFGQGMVGCAKEELWESFQIENPELQSEFLALADGMPTSTFNEVMDIIALFLQEAHNGFITHLQGEKAHLWEYIQSLKIGKKRTAVMDIGWTGSLQRSIESLFVNQGIKADNRWYYLATSAPFSLRERHSKARGFLVERGIPLERSVEIKQKMDVFELLFSAPLAPVRSVEKVGDDYRAVHMPTNPGEELRMSVSGKIFQGALDISKAYRKYHGDKMYAMSPDLAMEFLHGLEFDEGSEIVDAFSKIEKAENSAHGRHQALKLPEQMKKG